MSIPARLTASAVAVVALAAVPSVASAQTSQLRGVVSGSPYGASNNSMAIPVLFSKMTARSAGLRSPVGVIILKRTQKVKLPDGSFSLPVNLRNGDRFKGVGQITSVNRRTFYPRVPLTRSAVVYFRSKEMSLAELTAAVDALRKALAALKIPDGVDLTGLQNQINDLKNQLAGLKIPPGVDLSGLQAQIDDLKKQLAGLQLLSNTDVTNIVTSVLGSLSFDTSALQDLIGSVIDSNATIQNLQSRLDTVCNAITHATVTIDPDGAGVLPAVQAPVSIPSVASACP